MCSWFVGLQEHPAVLVFLWVLSTEVDAVGPKNKYTESECMRETRNHLS